MAVWLISSIDHAAGSGPSQRADHWLQPPSSTMQQLIAEADSAELRRIIVAAADRLESLAGSAADQQQWIQHL